MIIKNTYVLRKTFINLTYLNFRLVQQKKSKNDKKMPKIATFWAQSGKNDLLTLNYGLHSSFNTLSTCRTTKRC